MSIYWWIHPLRTFKVWRQVRAHNKKYPAGRKQTLREVLRTADIIQKRGEESQ